MSAGASLYHPHFQVVALPIIPPDVEHSLSGSLRYFRRKKRCAHCAIISFEKKEGYRVLAQNQEAIAITPYASEQPFEIKIYPAGHFPYFEATPRRAMQGVVLLLQRALLTMRTRLGDPDLNFFIHTSPLKHQNRYRHYHWHVEILPKVSIPAGFELSTGVIINAVEPHRAVQVLKGRQ